MPFLKALDNYIVSDYEVQAYLDMYDEDVLRSLANLNLRRFKPGMYPFYSLTSLESHNIGKALAQESYDLRRKCENHSPVLTIQKTLRMHLQKRKFKTLKRHVKIMFWVLRRWHKRLRFFKCIAYHKKKRRVTTREELRICGAARKIQKEWRAYKRRKLIR